MSDTLEYYIKVMAEDTSREGSILTYLEKKKIWKIKIKSVPACTFESLKTNMIIFNAPYVKKPFQKCGYVKNRHI